MSFTILGTGSYAPEHVVTNDDLAKIVETNDEWIMQRIGVKSRHICDTETNVDLAVEASVRALEDAGVAEADTDYLQVHLDRDDGAEIYDVEFAVFANDGSVTEYDYEIDAATGEIRSLDHEAERITLYGGSNSQNGVMAEDKQQGYHRKENGFHLAGVKIAVERG